MSGELRFYGQNNLRRNLAGPQYPEEIVLQDRDLEFFVRISPLIETLDEINGQTGTLVIEQDLFFPPWPLIVDLLFPYELPERHMPAHELFMFRENGNPYLNPLRTDASMAKLQQIVDYFMIGNPREMNDVLLRFAYMRPGAPERPRNAEFTTSPSEELRQERAYTQRLRNLPPANNVAPPNNEWNWPENNNNENQGPELGFTEEEEEALSRLQGANVHRYFRGGKTRRVKKLNKKTRKH